MMMRAKLGTAHAAEAALRLIDAGLGAHIFDGMIDALRLEMRMQLEPVGRKGMRLQVSTAEQFPATAAE